MPRPKDCEFSKETIIEALKRSHFSCERCGIPKKDTMQGYLEIHHMLGIAMALKFYPHLSFSVISSVANARVLCFHCHQVEDNEAKYTHPEMAVRLENENNLKYLLSRKRPKRIA